MTDVVLNPKHQRFVDEYLVDLNATEAAKRAGYSEKTAKQQGSRLLTNADITAAIASRQVVRGEETGITAARVLQELWEIATADPNELIQYRVGACEECWTEDDGESVAGFAGDFAGDPDQPERKFDRARTPNPECMACAGEGMGRVYVPDTRTLTGPARRLYAGVKTTKEGLEIKMRSQDAALAKVFEHLGMGVKRLEVGGPGGGPIQLQTDLVARVGKLSPEDRDQLRQLALKMEGQG